MKGPHVLRIQRINWEPLSIVNGKVNEHFDITKNKVMALVLAWFKVRHMFDEFWPDILCIQNCLNAALTSNAKNQVWFASTIGDYSVALQRTSDGIYFVTGWAEDFHQFYDELSWIS